ncbi:putative exported protein [Candidatus Burkholderia verschuerenii]|uniref:Putative exported protein n=1 Tax=Candidatus Burkholderia verschuerenii TaxID=242163 RepID=A0A0L0M758_9BURK|nr:putative exported protein [Candidatus Burkholderia verschuerenii]
MSSVTKSSLANAGQTLRGVVHARRTRRIVIGLIIAILVIGALGFFVAPPIIRHVAEQQLTKLLDRPVSIRRIGLNPYMLDFDAEGVHIGESQANLAKAPDSSNDFADVSRLVVRTSWASLFKLAPVVNELKVDSPRINVVRYDAEHFNFSDLIEKFSKPSPEPSKSPAKFSVSNIRIENGNVTFDDRLLKAKHVVDRFALHIPFIATLPSATEIFVTPLLQARIDGSPLLVKGRTKPFSQSRESDVALSLDDLDVPQLAAYAPASVPVAIKSGKLSTDLNVRFSIAGDTPTIRIDGQADLADLDVTDRANAPLVKAGKLHVKIADAEPLRSVYNLDDITLTNPDVQLSRDASGVLNVQKLASSKPAAEPVPKEEKEATPLDLSIKHVGIDGGHIGIDDQLMKQRVQLALSNLAVTLDDFSTLAKTPARYTLKTALDHGGSLDASGNVTLASKTADVKLAVDALALPPLQPYLANAFAGRVTSGTLGANLPISVDWSKPDAAVQVASGDVKLDALTLTPNAANGAPIKLASAVAKIDKVDVAARNAQLASVQLSGLSLDATRRKDGSIDLASLAGPHDAAPESSATHKVQKAQEAGPAWHYRIGQIALNDASANLTDETPAKPVKLRVAPLSVRVKQFSDDLSKPLDVDGKLTLNGKGAVAIGGNVTVNPLKFALHVKSDQLDASAFEPYFGDKLNVEIASANLNANGDMTLAGSGKSLAATYKGDVSLSDVRTIDKLTNDRFAGWKLLGLTNVKVNYSERGTDIDAAKVTFSNFYGRVLLDAQGRLNLKGVVAGDNGTTQPVTKDKTAPAPAPVAKTAEKTGPPVNARFGELVLQNGRVTYTDNFIKPNYTANLVAINGTIGAFGTQSKTPAPVDVSAKLAANGPVAIKGQVNPLIDKPALDLTATAHDIELANLTPYSSKYAGYPITKGKLNVDLHYMLADEKLSANNHLFIDQLTFGDHVDNTTATKLPVRLAISLLKNSRGEIDVNIPISGSLDNPEFSIGGLIWQAFLNLVQKAVTAPFTLLAHAFGGGSGEDLNYIEFDPGSANLNDAAQKEARNHREGARGQAVDSRRCDGPRRSESRRTGAEERVGGQPGQARESARHVGQRRKRGLERDQGIGRGLRQILDQGLQERGLQEADEFHRHDQDAAGSGHEVGVGRQRARR